MTLAGWINLILSVGSVTLLFAWCLYKVLTHNPPAEPVLEDLFHDEDVPSDKA
jgi:hypothetical protein